MVRAMHEEQEFSDMFMKFLLARRMRIQADLVDQLFNSKRKSGWRGFLVLMAEFGQSGERERCFQDLAGDSGGDGRHHPVRVSFPL